MCQLHRGLLFSEFRCIDLCKLHHWYLCRFDRIIGLHELRRGTVFDRRRRDSLRELLCRHLSYCHRSLVVDMHGLHAWHLFHRDRRIFDLHFVSLGDFLCGIKLDKL